MNRLTLLLTFLLATAGTSNAQWEIVRIDAGIKPAIALGPECTAEIGYMLESSNGYVRHASVAPQGSPVITPIDEGYFYGPLDIAASAGGDVFINYHDHDLQDQVVAIRNNGAWTLEQVMDPGHDGWDNSILVTESGIVHTSSVDPSSFGGRGVEYARRSATGFWNVEGVGSPSIMYANATSIVLKNDGEPAIAYYNDTAGDLELAERSAGMWSISVVDSAGDVGRFPSMVTDAEGNLHVAYYKVAGARSGVIRYASRLNDAWTTIEVDSLKDVQLGSTGARRNVALALDESGAPQLAYGDRSVIKHASLTASGIEVETIIDETNTPVTLGQLVDMSLCPDDGGIHLVYFTVSQTAQPDEVWYVRPGMSTGTEDAPQEDLLRVEIFPNPSAGRVNLRFTGGAGNNNGMYNLKVFDVLGRTVYDRSLQGNAAGQENVVLRDLSSGVYVVQLEAGDRRQVSSFVVLGH